MGDSPSPFVGAVQYLHEPFMQSLTYDGYSGGIARVTVTWNPADGPMQQTPPPLTGAWRMNINGTDFQPNSLTWVGQNKVQLANIGAQPTQPIIVKYVVTTTTMRNELEIAAVAPQELTVPIT